MQAHVGGGEARGCLTLGENKSWVAASWCSPGGHLQATVSSSDTTCHPGGHSLVHRTLPEGVPLGTTTPTTDSGTLAGLGLLWPQEGGVNSQGGSLLKLLKGRATFHSTGGKMGKQGPERGNKLSAVPAGLVPRPWLPRG